MNHDNLFKAIAAMAKPITSNKDKSLFAMFEQVMPKKEKN